LSIQPVEQQMLRPVLTDDDAVRKWAIDVIEVPTANVFPVRVHDHFAQGFRFLQCSSCNTHPVQYFLRTNVQDHRLGNLPDRWCLGVRYETLRRIVATTGALTYNLTCWCTGGAPWIESCRPSLERPGTAPAFL
jgi:hypothetical protein